MKAAIYARKSNDDNDQSPENKSITRQVERAKAYAESKGWLIDDDLIFVDDGISGAEFKERPGLLRLLSATKPRKFDVLVVSEISRIGRDMIRNAVVVDDVISAGARIFYYLTDKEETADTPEARLMLTLSSFAAEMERAKTAERTRDALERRAASGYSAGGACFGYTSTPVLGVSANGEQIRTHTGLSINDNQAEIVRAIFQMYADGYGLTTVAKTLNGDPKHKQKNLKYFCGQTPPSPQNGTSSWAPSCIRAMLYRKRYIGILEYGKMHRTRSTGGSKRVKGEPTVTTERPELRIVPQPLWEAVHARLDAARATYLREQNGNLWGRPESGRESKYLLSGLARCADCGGNIVVVGGQKTKQGTHYYYYCSTRLNRGPTVCPVETRARMDETNKAVLTAIERIILTPDAIDQVLEKAAILLRQRLNERPEAVPRLEAEIKKVRKELDNFLALVASGNAPASILGEIMKREERIKTLESELLRYHVPQQMSDAELIRFRKWALARIEKFSELLTADVSKARQALRKLMRDADGNFAPLVFTPVDKQTFAFEGQILAGVLFNNVSAEDGNSPLFNNLVIPFRSAA